ncbi:hypothetical protein ABZ016_39350 [Streptomyces sp. NPDC006372]|uniref:hypothetical protein n=1 Tax=Streptomyces sp. NPDC006372 TaxID=3155599 RepID=UPI00339FE179
MERVRRILERTGARDTVERMIVDHCGDALAALDRAGFPPQVASVLRRIATHTVHRTT